MSRESPNYRLNLESLRERFPGREQISLDMAAHYLGTSKRRLLEDDTFPTRLLGQQKIVILTNFAHWLAQ